MLEKIEEGLALRRMTADALERKAGLPKSRIGKWKGGQGRPSAEQAFRIAQVLGVTLESLVNDEVELDGAPTSGLMRRICQIAADIGPEIALRRLYRLDDRGGETPPAPAPRPLGTAILREQTAGSND